MATEDEDRAAAEARMDALRRAGHAVRARYDRRRARVVIGLSTGLELALPARLVEGLAGAPPDSLADIEISPAGLGLRWPRLDADVYVPALLEGVFGSERWMASLAPGPGRRPAPDAPSARPGAAGAKGGRPRRTARSSS